MTDIKWRELNNMLDTLYLEGIMCLPDVDKYKKIIDKAYRKDNGREYYIV